MFPNICHEKFTISGVTTLPQRDQEWLLSGQAPQDTATAHSHVQEVKETWQKAHPAVSGTPDGAPMQKGRVGKADAWMAT